MGVGDRVDRTGQLGHRRQHPRRIETPNRTRDFTVESGGELSPTVICRPSGEKASATPDRDACGACWSVVVLLRSILISA